MVRSLRLIVAGVLVLFAANRAPAALVDEIAADNAADADAYGDGWSAGDNGGFGFGEWIKVGQLGSDGFGGGFIGSSAGGDIDVSGSSFGVFGNNDGVGEAIRSFNADLEIGQTFSISMDTVGVDLGGTAGFALQNMAENNLVEFFFVGGGTSYTVNGDGVSGTTPGFTTGGLTLSLTLTDADSFSLEIDELSTGPGSDHTVLGDLLGSPDQGIEKLRLFNANGGPNIYFNSLSITAAAIPEASPAYLMSVVGMAGYGTSVRRKRVSLSR